MILGLLLAASVIVGAKQNDPDAQGFAEQTWNEKYFGDLTGIGALAKVANVKCGNCRYQPVANSSFTHLNPEDELK